MPSLLLLLLAGCSPAVLPEVAIQAPYQRYAMPWEEIGFSVVGSSELERCPRPWLYGMNPDCQIPIVVTVFPRLLEVEGTLAMTRQTEREIVLDDDLAEINLPVAIAHETGHIVLATGEHTHGGIMGGASLYVTEEDRALACRAIGVC